MPHRAGSEKNADSTSSRELSLHRAHLRVGVVGVVFTAIAAVATIVGTLAALGLFDGSGTASPSTDRAAVRSSTSTTKQEADPSDIELPEGLPSEQADAYRAIRLRELQRDSERLRAFVTARVGLPTPCESALPPDAPAVAALRCTIEDVQVSYTRLPGGQAADDYFGDRLQHSVSQTWTGRYRCWGRWSFWQDVPSGRRMGYMASRRRGDRALLVWGYARWHVVAVATAPARRGGHLCDLWREHS